ncbi:unnamed protein product [Adineta ricciae]|uniref:Uncharacterized protein n=1 Tax=Adineta ricciae TaxID=249248 RepID=A0A814SFR3_ADIRI|nr:unnamed protein product [Adineta ricciae]CAF1145839.1 unnamed protein product [Adineta ricciae]
MASNNDRTTSYLESGFSERTAARSVNPRYACYWLDSCQGQHEFDDCSHRPNELNGKLGIYYSPNAEYRLFDRDEINRKILTENPTGCTMVQLLIYKIDEDATWLLFVSKRLKEKRFQSESMREQLLAFPSANPRRKFEDRAEVALQALKTITDQQEILQDYQLRLKRFLFVDAISAYPFQVTPSEAKLLMNSYSSNDEVHSVHWFPLTEILNGLPEWPNYLAKEQTEHGLAQIKHDRYPTVQLRRDVDGRVFTIWSVTVSLLLCIRNHVGFQEFFS